MATKEKDKKREVNPIDVHIGQTIRKIRRMKNMTLEDVAKQIGVGFQQVQKYEEGRNRMAGSRLVKISEALEVPVARLFGKYAEQGESDFMAQLDDRKVVKLIAYYQAMNEEEQENLLKNAKFLADEG